MTRRTAAVTALVSAVGLLVSLVALVAWSGRQVERDDPVVSRATAGPESSPTARQRDPGSRVRTTPASLPAPTGSVDRPVRVTIASVGLQAPIRPVGVAPDGQMALPADPEVLGWYRFGAAPASPAGGSVVLAGHLDSTRFGLGPLVRLREVGVGSAIRIVTAAGQRHDYVVRRVERFDQEGLPEELFARSGPELVRLITCGGAYDPETGYEENLVVTAARSR